MKLLFTVFYDPKDLGVRYLKSYLTLKGHDVHIVALKELSDLPQSSFTPNETFLETCTTVRAGYATSYNFCPITDQELDILQILLDLEQDQSTFIICLASSRHSKKEQKTLSWLLVVQVLRLTHNYL